MLEARRRVPRRGDGDAIHDLRVATRRLQAALDVFASLLPERRRRRLERRARKLRRSLGTQRNAWVMLGLVKRLRPGLTPEEERIVAGLERRMARVAGSARRFRPGDRLPGIRERIEAVVRAVGRGVGRPAEALRGDAPGPTRAAAVVRACRGARNRGAEAMHRLRIAIKRHRYTLEVLAEAGRGGLEPAIRAARALQGDLGDLHDLDVLIEMVRRETRTSGAARLLRRLLRARSARARRALRRVAAFQQVATPAVVPATGAGRTVAA